MSECIVRISIPACCYLCPLWGGCESYNMWIMGKADMPEVLSDGCLFMGELPENHGRLARSPGLWYCEEKEA